MAGARWPTARPAGRGDMDLMTRIWLKRLFWALLALAAVYALVGRG